MTNVTKNQLLAYINAASESYNGFSVFRDFVLDYYYGEEEYHLNDSIEEVYSVLAPYLESEEAVRDKACLERFRRLATFINKYGWAKEVLISGLYYNDIIELMKKYSSNLIDKSIFRRKIVELTPVDFNPLKLLDLISKINSDKSK